MNEATNGRHPEAAGQPFVVDENYLFAKIGRLVIFNEVLQAELASLKAELAARDQGTETVPPDVNSPFNREHRRALGQRGPKSVVPDTEAVTAEV